MRRLAFLAPFLLTACVTWTPRSAHTSATASVIPNMPMQNWGIESCGAGSLSTVLQHYGETTSMPQWEASLPKVHGGVLTIDLLVAARAKGFDAQLVTGDRSIVEGELREGRPVILMLQVVDSPGHQYDFFHYIVADGIDAAGGLIRTQFGDGKGRWTTLARLEKPWSGGGHAAILIRPRDQNDLTAALREAVALEDAGNVAEAAKHYRELLSHHPDSSLAWTNLGNAESHLGHREEAERAFREAVTRDAGARDALNNLAWLLFEEKRLDEAEPFARKAVALGGPDSYLTLDTLARILAARGSCAEAVTRFREALDAVPAGRAAARSDLEKGMADAQASCRS